MEEIPFALSTRFKLLPHLQLTWFAEECWFPPIRWQFIDFTEVERENNAVLVFKVQI